MQYYLCAFNINKLIFFFKQTFLEAFKMKVNKLSLEP